MFVEKLKFHLRRLGIFLLGSDPKSTYITLATRCGILVILISYHSTTAWYLVFETQTPKEHSESLFFVLISFLMLSWYSIFLFQSEKYATILDELNAIIGKRMLDPTVNLIYEKTNSNIEWMTEKIFFIFRQFRSVYVLVPAIISLFNYITSGFSNDSFQQAYPASYPFDWKTPLGYAACVFIQLLTAMVAVEVYISVMVLTVGVCMMITDFASDIKEKLHQFNRILISSDDEEFDWDKERVVVKKKLNEIIEFHSEAREFANRFSDVNSAIVFTCPLFTIAVFGSLVLQVNLLTKTGDIVGIVQIAMTVTGSLFPFFMFCHFGGKITQQFEDIGNAAYQLEWYRLPLDMQKDLRIVIALTQKRIYMRGYGDTRSTHSVFKKILRNKFFYFILARKF